VCGIIGQRNFREAVDVTAFLARRDAMAHRGPDGAGLHLSPDGATALGHRRLSIIDLSDAGRQPMCNEDGTLWLTYNGEIYNYRALRKELAALGHRFCSATDSEILLHGYEEWGRSLLPRLEGMFAFAIWDDTKGRFFLARDRFGIKPLYYSLDPSRFAFASELKGLVGPGAPPPSLDPRSVIDFFVYRYVPSPRTIWRGVAKLPPAHFLEVDAVGSAHLGRWWDLGDGRERIDFDAAAERLDAGLERAVADHTVGDVPVGLFLSGGYDSTAVADYAQRSGYQTHAFSIGFEGWPESEHRWAERVAECLSLPITVRELRPVEVQIAEQLPVFFDEPLADPSIVPTFAVSELASGYVKAVLSGEGGDELFGGYHWQRAYKEEHRRHPWWVWLTDRVLPGNDSHALRRYGEAMSASDDRKERRRIRELFHPDLHSDIPEDLFWFFRSHLRRDLSPLKRMQYLDIHTFLPELVLTKADRASMAHSLEVRVPLLDHRLHETLFNLDEDVAYRCSTGQSRDSPAPRHFSTTPLGTHRCSCRVACSKTAGSNAPRWSS
jgi:asparagine synthase (glutamine-hydrolysing)